MDFENGRLQDHVVQQKLVEDEDRSGADSASPLACQRSVASEALASTASAGCSLSAAASRLVAVFQWTRSAGGLCRPVRC